MSNIFQDVTTSNMDHHGLVSSICKDLQIATKIDKRLVPDPNRKVSAATSVVAMIINGLGYTNRTLYMSHHFFASKPIDRLLGSNIQSTDLTDHTLARALDDIYAYGTSKLFMEVAMEIALEHNLLGRFNHLDTTTFSLQGDYANQDDCQSISITHGYSKDHRPDLKQVVLSLVANGPSGIPISMESLSGNSSDKQSFHESIKKVESFKQQIDLNQSYTWVADSALYTRDKLLKSNAYKWVTRVPETIKQARELIEKEDSQIIWEKHDNGYKTSMYTCDYGAIDQKWLLVYSQQSYDKEKKTLENKLEKEKHHLKQDLWHLSNQIFSCKADAHKAIKSIIKKQKLLVISYELECIKGYLRCGKPKVGEEQVIKGYKVLGNFIEDIQAVELLLRKKGRFILATNNLDTESLSNHALLATYKDQQKVESGFRFLKDPLFMVDKMYLKLPSRIDALMMVMSLTLLVYNVGQYKLRERLNEEQTTLPNQLGKAINNPTLRWIFQMLEGIGVIYVGLELSQGGKLSHITNINALREKIIRLFGSSAMEIYGLIEKKEVL